MSKTESVREHFKNNYKTYLIGAGCATLGVIGTIAFMYEKQIVINDSFNMSLYSPKENIVTTILERRGHPGNMIRCIETGEVFASQNRAATVMNLNAGQLAQYFKGRHDHVKGFTFENLGEAV